MIDLSKKYSGYFNKLLLRSVFFLLFCVGVYLFVSNGFSLEAVYVHCPSDSRGNCINPFYCDRCSAGRVCSRYEDVCSQALLSPGESLGVKPSFLLRFYSELSLLVIALSFALNHFLYRRKNANKTMC
jgi:hypothetical protein